MTFLPPYLNYLFIFLGLLGIGLLKLTITHRQQIIDGVYEKKKYLITKAERELFMNLQQAVGEQYYIFPQTNLDKLFLVKGDNWYSFRNRIKQKSVDFVLCDKEYLSPILAIELNDSSHNEIKRIERDIFVNKVFSSARMPLLTLLWQPTYDKESLRSQIYETINHS